MASETPFEYELWRPPVLDHAFRDLVELLAHKGDPWIGDIRRRLAGAMEGAQDYYFVARYQDQLVGHVWYTTLAGTPELGLIGHVYTVPPFRRRGISARLVEMALDDFRQRGGRAMQLFTSTPYTLDFYGRFEFENLYQNQAYHATDWYMCSPSGAYEELQRAVAGTRGVVKPLSAGALPQFCLLYNIERRTRLKNRAQKIGLGLEAELAFIHSWQEVDSGRTICHCTGDDHFLTGVAAISRLEFPHQAHIGMFDLYVEPNNVWHADELAEACLAARDTLGIETLYAMAVDPDKERMLQHLGFRAETTLPRHFRVAAQYYDVQVYRFAGTDQ